MSGKQSIAWSKGDIEHYGDYDDCISTSSSSKRQITLTQLSAVNSLKAAPKKIKVTTIDVSPSKRFKTVSTQTNFDTATIGSIVGINGYDLDNGRYKVKRNAPMFFGLVMDPRKINHPEGADDLKDDELFVKFVVSGEYEWYDKNVPNCTFGNYKKSKLVLCHPPLGNMSGSSYYEKVNDSSKWFDKTQSGWVVKVFEDPCYGCGSPWCLYHENRAECKQLLSDIGDKSMPNKQKRYHCYRDAISMKWGTLGHASRKRVGWCWENKCRVAFPEKTANYTGYKEHNGVESGEE